MEVERTSARRGTPLRRKIPGIQVPEHRSTGRTYSCLPSESNHPDAAMRMDLVRNRQVPVRENSLKDAQNFYVLYFPKDADN